VVACTARAARRSRRSSSAPSSKATASFWLTFSSAVARLAASAASPSPLAATVVGSRRSESSWSTRARSSPALRSPGRASGRGGRRLRPQLRARHGDHRSRAREQIERAGRADEHRLVAPFLADRPKESSHT
jgi:hypothetical protein